MNDRRDAAVPGCCQGGGGRRSPFPSRWLRRLSGLCAWLAPATVLVAMPKCPLCLAGYVALMTGLGLSVSAAWYLQHGLVVLSVFVLTWLSLRRIFRAPGAVRVRTRV